ncbi:MAG: PQQ-dependent sugar dehydrogenase [Acidimicrobiia bacterium]
MRRISLAIVLLAVVGCGDDGAAQPTTTGPVATTAGVTSTTDPASTTTIGPTTTTVPTATVPLDSVGDLVLDPVGEGFTSPVFVTARPGDDRLYVVNQEGTVQSMNRDGSDAKLVLDIRDRVWFAGERGLLGLAFHPDSPERAFVHYSRIGDFSTTIVEYHLPTDGSDPERVQLILSHPQPAQNHNGGMIAFGPDGYLYIALGDGGGGGDQYRNGQDPFTLLGAILRIDVDSGDRYAIPSGNPFADGSDGAPEVFFWGLRNPWRFSFDGTDLWVADVGQGSWEEINRVGLDMPGANLGWPILEGTHCYDGPEELCGDNAFLGPVHEYSHDGGRCSVTGGYVYRGADHPELDGVYFFGDYCSTEIMAIRVEGGEVTDSRIFTTGLEQLSSFGVDHDGELYITTASGVYRIGFGG